KGLPGIFFALQALHALGFGFFLWNLAHLFPLSEFRGQDRLQKRNARVSFCCTRAFGKPD
ncbi:MAG: hypothetical protein WCC73_00555, partial [Terracidiphilus sp.]